MFYFAEVKYDNEVIERSLVYTKNEIKGYNYAEARYMTHYDGDNKYSFDFIKAKSDIPNAVNGNSIKFPLSEVIDILVVIA